MPQIRTRIRRLGAGLALAAGLAGFVCGESGGALPEGFVYLRTVAPEVVQDLRYATAENFVGVPVDGYESGRAILTRPAAEALQAVAEELRAAGLALKVFDAYRPQRAVLHFVRWAKDASDTATKAHYYPDVAKADLFAQGYLALESGHSRGSTVDLTLVRREGAGAGGELEMGTPFDFLGKASASRSEAVSAEAQANRRRLRAVMERHGWIASAREWWHFTLRDEPYPETYFDFPVR